MSKIGRKTAQDEMRAEYDFDYSKARPNRFASRMRGDAVTVVLAPDVAQVFDNSESVNQFLRTVIAAMPERGPRGTTRKQRKKAG